ncbi:3-phosphoglycerate dehydrogenase family protein [Gammaproteobacteria bacterium]|nr:3-phosphoglycerate dehydrogenase family protein [Gammaproteobacteria bacterium]
MYTYKTFNNISKQALSLLSSAAFKYDDDQPDAILLRSHNLNSDDFGERLKSIARAGAGFNNIPVDVATQKGIVVFNTPGANSNAVKELVLCGMLLSSRGIIQGNAFAKSLIDKKESEINKLMEKEKKNFKGNELKGKVLGIVGLGSVGSLLAQAASILGMKIIGYDPYISIDSAWMLPKEVEKAETLEFLFSKSDYISLHVPLSDNTKNLISKKLLDFVKEDAKLINLSRGGVVNNVDLINALNNKKLTTYVTDFPTPELIKRSVNSGDVILLPHLGASTKEAEINCSILAAEQTKNYLENGLITNSVNFPNVKLSRTSKFRIVIVHKDEPGIIGTITSEIAKNNLNISDMINKSRNEIAVTLIDINDTPSEYLLKKIQDTENVLTVRVC